MGANPRKTKAKGADNAPGSGPAASTAAIEARVDAVDWTKVQAELDVQGWAVAPKLLTHAEADSIAGLYSQERGFRSHVIMARHGFGRGEYKYFSYPLPPLIQALRTAAYPHLVPIANQWQERMGKELRFPGDHAAFLDRCHQAGQPARPRCCSNTRRRITTASIATSTGSMSSPCRSRSCWINPARISRAASS